MAKRERIEECTENYLRNLTLNKIDNWKLILDNQYDSINIDYIKNNIITDSFIKEFFNMYSTSSDYERLKEGAKEELMNSVDEKFRKKCYSECKSYFSRFSKTNRINIPYNYSEIVIRNLKKILLDYLHDYGTRYTNSFAKNIYWR